MRSGKQLWSRGAVAAVAVAVLALPLVALAQAPEPITLPNPITITDPRILIGRVIGVALGLVGSIALLLFMWGGFMWMTSVGNPERVSKGKMTILWAAIGLAVIFTSYALVNFVLKGLQPPGQTGQGQGQVGAGQGQAGQAPAIK